MMMTAGNDAPNVSGLGKFSVSISWTSHIDQLNAYQNFGTFKMLFSLNPPLLEVCA